jgi:hypothetical protein
MESAGTKKIDEFTISKFEVNKTVSSGATLLGPNYAKAGATIKYAVEIEAGYILSNIKVDGKDIPYNNNQFIVENINQNTIITVEAVAFNAPIAQDIQIDGDFLSGNTVEVKYTYFDPNNKPEAGTLVSWYVDGAKVGDGKTLDLLHEWAGKNIEVRVTAKSSNQNGIEQRTTSLKVVELFGDLNNDGVVNNIDIKTLLEIINGRYELTETQKYYAKITGENATLADVRELLKVAGGK